MFDQEKQIGQISSKAFSYLGDAVFELYVRNQLVQQNLNVDEMNKIKRDVVNARAQVSFFESIKDFLKEEELRIFKRGRNSKTNHHPKAVSAIEYKIASGLEALFGFLFYTKQYERIKELFDRSNIKIGE